MNALELRRRTLGKGVYKKTVEGNPAIAQGSLARRYLGITMQGWTEQAQYEGKNLFDFKALTIPNDRTIIYNPIYLGDGTFTLSTDFKDSSGAFALYILPGNVQEGAGTPNGVDRSTSKTVVSSEGYVTVAYRRATDLSNPLESNIMLNSGSTALPYEPYTGGAPSPSPDYKQDVENAGKYNEETGKYQYEVKLTGKNLIPSYSELSDWMSGDYRYIPVTGFVIGETYTFSQSVVPELGEGFYVALGTVAGTVNTGTVYWIYHSAVQNLCVKSITFVATQETYYLNAAGFGSTNMSRFLSVFPDLMVELGTERTEYEPYKEQTVTLTSDRPLTKWDKLEKRNGQWGWVYKSAEIESYTDESVPGEYYSTTGQLSVGAQVWYETATKTFVPLFPEEQKQMNALHTFRPTTVLSNDCDCNMILTYKTKKSLEVTT